MTEALYQKRAFSRHHRQLLSIAQRAVRGIPADMRRVYGHLMTEEMAEEIYPYIMEVARLRDYQAAQELLRRTLPVSEGHAKEVSERFVRLLHYLKSAEYSSRSALRLRALREGKAARLRKSGLVQKDTLEIAEMMLAEGATAREVAQYLHVPVAALSRALGYLIR